MLPQPVDPDPHQKIFVDGLYEAKQRRRSWRAWIVWCSVLTISLVFLYAFNHDLITGWLGTTIAVLGIAGVFGFLAFLSTFPFGQGDGFFGWWW